MPTQLSPGVNVSEIDLTTIVPAVATSTGAIAGIFNWGPVNQRILIDTESNLVNIFGRPTPNNPETFFTAANFLGYTNALWVVRAANTTSANTLQATKNSFANTAALANAANTPVVLNNTDYLSKANTFDGGILYVAKYPGATYGNSLRVSVCDTVNAYSSNLNLVANADTSATVTANIGANQFTVVVSSVAANVVSTGTYAAALAANLTLGDLVGLGNSSIGTQYLSISNIGSTSTVGTNTVFTVNTYTTYNLSTQFIGNSTSSNTINRRWEFAGAIGAAPITSAYQAQFGNAAIVDTMHVVVQDAGGVFTGTPGAILETWANVSRATDSKAVDGSSNYYQTSINYGSNYIWVVNDRAGAVSNTTNNVISSTNYSALSMQFAGGQDGFKESDSNTALLATVTSGYNYFTSPEDVDISLVLQGKPIGGSTTSGGYTVNNFQLANWIIDNICAVRKDCVVFVTPSDDAVTNNPGAANPALVAWRNVIHDSSYAVLDSGYKFQLDRYNDVNRYVPTNGDIAGLCARTDNQRDPWWSPAGFNRGQIKNVIQMRHNPKQSNRDLLYSNGINPVISIPGQGTILYGDKTLQSKPSAFDRINVRRLFIVLEKAISLAAKYSLFEFNDAFTQAQFKNLVTPYLRQIQGRRGITDFLVVCDATNNTPAVVDANQFVGDIYIKPARSINFIQLNFVAVGTGVTFSAIVGKF